MNVGQLRSLLEGLSDDIQVLIPMSSEFDGMFYTPCMADSGVSKMMLDDVSEEDIRERELLGQPIGDEDTFCLVPCGYYEEHDDRHKLN